ncbi:hypothetical protein AgCh_006087 [Apium graveolens]
MLPVVSKPLPAIFVHCDSRTTIDKVRSVKYNAKTKRHIQVRLKFIRGLVSDMIIAIEFIGTQDNIVDPLTKGIEHAIVLKSRLGMGLVVPVQWQQIPSRLEARSFGHGKGVLKESNSKGLECILYGDALFYL